VARPRNRACGLWTPTAIQFATITTTGTPSRPTKILFGVGAFLVVAGFLVVITIANHFHSHPIPVLLLIIVIALVGSGGLIVGGLVLAAFLRQNKATRSEGWPPR
jgi:dipeptide/tripeptide permease